MFGSWITVAFTQQLCCVLKKMTRKGLMAPAASEVTFVLASSLAGNLHSSRLAELGWPLQWQGPGSATGRKSSSTDLQKESPLPLTMALQRKTTKLVAI